MPQPRILVQSVRTALAGALGAAVGRAVDTIREKSYFGQAGLLALLKASFASRFAPAPHAAAPSTTARSSRRIALAL